LIVCEHSRAVETGQKMAGRVAAECTEQPASNRNQESVRTDRAALERWRKYD